MHVDPETGDTKCLNINECQVVNAAQLGPQCTCERCICIDQPGTYKCALWRATNAQQAGAGCYHAAGCLLHQPAGSSLELGRQLVHRSFASSSKTAPRCTAALGPVPCPLRLSAEQGHHGCTPASALMRMHAAAPGSVGTWVAAIDQRCVLTLPVLHQVCGPGAE